MTKPTGKPRVTGYHIVTTELLDLLELLYRYKYLRTSFIRQLLDCGEQGIIRQLKLRREQGYTHQPPEQRRGYNNLWCPRIHSITKKGEQVLLDHDRHPLKVTRLHRPKSDAPIKNFAHAMMICDTLASIEIGLKGTEASLIPWTEIMERAEGDDPMRLPFDASYQGKPVRGKLVPDGLFGIRYPDGTASFFALEAEHFNPVEPSDLNRASTLKKLLAYQDIIKRKTFKKLGIPNLRVLFVAPTMSRREHMVELATRLYGSTNRYLFHEVPVQEQLLVAPPPFPSLVTSEWRRAGLSSVPLFSVGDGGFTANEDVV
jgi:hypothetical protein